MEEKNYTEVLINGNVYTLGGAEDPEYLQKVAAYINEKVAVLKAQPGFTRQNKDYQEVMIYLNLADDYFKTLQEAMMLRAQKDGRIRKLLLFALQIGFSGGKLVLLELQGGLNGGSAISSHTGGPSFSSDALGDGSGERRLVLHYQHRARSRVLMRCGIQHE